MISFFTSSLLSVSLSVTYHLFEWCTLNHLSAAQCVWLRSSKCIHTILLFQLQPFCLDSSVWHQAGSEILCLCFGPLHDDFDEQMPRHSCTKGELHSSACKNISPPALASIGGDERGKPENTQETKHLRFCGAVQEVPDSLGGKVTFFFHAGHFSEG